MIACPNCKTENEDDAKFCTNCGTALTAAQPGAEPAAPPPPTAQTEPARPGQHGPIADDGLPVGIDLDGEPGGERLLWEGRPSWPLSWLNRILTRYRVTNVRLVIEHGFVRKHVEQVDLYRVHDVDYRQGVIERLFGLGDIGIETTDATAPEVELRDVKDPNRVKDIVWQAARIERQRRRVLLRDEV
jgi:Bacterial PH domain/zinc-ribbon domain